MSMSTPNSIRILVVDDHFMVRMGLRASLNAEPDMRVVGEAGSAEEAMVVFRAQRPDVVIMDLRLQGSSGIDAATRVLREFPEAKIFMLSTYGGEEGIYRAMQAGARGYVLKNAAREELLQAIRTVYAGGKYMDPASAQYLAERDRHPSLTARELQVLQMIVQGWSNKEIANSLGVAEVTIKQHVTHLLEKMGASDRTQAATLAIQRGVVGLDV